LSAIALLALLAAARAGAPPPGLGPAVLDAVVTDPGFERWFSGVIRVEQAGALVAEVARGNGRGGQPLDADSLFWLGSLSKTLCSAIVLQLADEGRLSLSDPLSAHLPGWDNTETCTVEQLLAHECGLPRDLSPHQQGSLLDPIRRVEIRSDYLAAVAAQPRLFAPGTDELYSNIGYNLAGLIVLQNEEGTWDEILQRRLGAPLGLSSTGIDASRIDTERMAPLAVNLGPLVLGGERWLGLPVDAPSRVGTAGNAFSTPREISRLFRALFHGDLLSESARSAMTTPRATDDRYGLGLIVLQQKGYTELAHNGALDPHGLSTHVAYIPEWDVTVAVMSNRSLLVYTASDVAGAVIQALRGREIRSPFPEGAAGHLKTLLLGGVFVVFPLLMGASLIWSAFKPIASGRLAWSLGVAALAWAVLFVRGGVGLHAGVTRPILLPLVLAVIVCWVVIHRMRQQPDLPFLPIAGRGRHTVGEWLNIAAGAAVLIGASVVVGFAAQTLGLAALAVGLSVLTQRYGGSGATGLSPPGPDTPGR